MISTCMWCVVSSGGGLGVGKNELQIRDIIFNLKFSKPGLAHGNQRLEIFLLLAWCAVLGSSWKESSQEAGGFFDL